MRQRAIPHIFISSKYEVSDNISLKKQFKSLNMKTATNKFDYPTALSHNYKLYKVDADDPSNKQQKILQKQKQDQQRYKNVIKQERENERARVKMEEQRRKELERINNKKKLQEEISNKKQELIELQKRKVEAMETEQKSYEMAMVRQQQQRLNQIQKQKKQRQNSMNAQNRFISALRRLQEEKDIANMKNKEAMMRRKVVEQTQKVQRDKATKYRELMKEKERNMPVQQKRSFKDYKQTLGRTAYNKNVDYTKSHFHNPLIIVPSVDSPEQYAYEKAEQMNNQYNEAKQEKNQIIQENRKISIERGERALEKIRLQQQYDQYRRQEEINSIKYNMQKIEAGKKNQYIGMKPATMAQMEAQRKIRREQEFQKMFFDNQTPEYFNRQATKYNIQGARLGNTEIPVDIIPLSRGNNLSHLADISDGHYSFEERKAMDQLSTVKKEEDLDEREQEVMNERSIGLNPMKEYEAKRETGKYKEDLSYSESSQEDSQNF